MLNLLLNKYFYIALCIIAIIIHFYFGISIDDIVDMFNNYYYKIFK